MAPAAAKACWSPCSSRAAPWIPHLRGRGPGPFAGGPEGQLDSGPEGASRGWTGWWRYRLSERGSTTSLKRRLEVWQIKRKVSADSNSLGLPRAAP